MTEEKKPVFHPANRKRTPMIISKEEFDAIMQPAPTVPFLQRVFSKLFRKAEHK